jgi:hypothetical protein
MEFTIELATPADDADIRRLLATNPIPGQITLTYEREPDYFLGCGTMGHFYQVVVARHQPGGELAGVVSRATRPLFVNGQVEEVGYLSQLRIDERFQGRWLMPQGFRFLRQLHAGGRVTGYLAAIIEDNEQATGILVKRPRRGYPTFRQICRLWTLALILRSPKSIPASTYEISRGSTANLGPNPKNSCPSSNKMDIDTLPFGSGSSGLGPNPKNSCPSSNKMDMDTLPFGSGSSGLGEIVAFLRQHGAARQFFPAYTEADFGDSPLTRDCKVKDFILARQQGELVGAIGLWDQSAYKQSVVQAYSGTLGRLRPLYNPGLRLIGAQPLPSPGEQIRFAYASFICIANNDPDIFDLLLRCVYNLATERGYAYLMVGLTENDPLLAVARRHFHIPYRSQLYIVCWDEENSWPWRLDNRIPYVEIAAL